MCTYTVLILLMIANIVSSGGETSQEVGMKERREEEGRNESRREKLKELFVDDEANRKTEIILDTVHKILGGSDDQPVLDENSTWAQLDTNSTWAVNLVFMRETRKELARCGDDLNCVQKYSWMRKITDAQGRRPSGLEFGNRYWLGSYEQCISVKAGDLPSNYGSPSIIGKYCTISIPTRFMNPVKLGICVLESYKEMDLQRAISQSTNVTGFSLVCHKTKSWNDDISSIIIVVLFCVLSIVILSATFIDAWFLREFIRQQPHSSGAHTILCKGLHRERKQINSYLHHFLSFSVLTNGACLFSSFGVPSPIDCGQTMRVFSLLLVMLLNTLTLLATADNPVQLWSMSNIAKALLNAGQVAPDTFFIVSGLVISYSWFAEMETSSKEKMTSPILTFPYAIIICFYASLYPHISEGPLWPAENSVCTESWWQNLLYINNYTGAKCMPWTWYIAVDFQLFVVSPLILVPLKLYPKIAGAFSAVLLCTVITGRAVAFSLIDFPPNAAPGLFSYNGLVDVITTRHWLYISTYLRYDAFLIGLLLGRIMHNKRPLWIGGKVINGFIWSLCVVYFLAHISIPYSMEHLPPIANGIYSGVSRTAWCILVAWVIYECGTGNANIINKFLTLKMWAPLGRLTYPAYLIHGIVYCFLRDNSDMPFHFQFQSQISSIIICAVFSYILAIIPVVAFA